MDASFGTTPLAIRLMERGLIDIGQVHEEG